MKYNSSKLLGLCRVRNYLFNFWAKAIIFRQILSPSNWADILYSVVIFATSIDSKLQFSYVLFPNFICSSYPTSLQYQLKLCWTNSISVFTAVRKKKFQTQRTRHVFWLHQFTVHQRQFVQTTKLVLLAKFGQVTDN